MQINFVNYDLKSTLKSTHLKDVLHFEFSRVVRQRCFDAVDFSGYLGDTRNTCVPVY